MSPNVLSGRGLPDLPHTHVLSGRGLQHDALELPPNVLSGRGLYIQHYSGAASGGQPSGTVPIGVRRPIPSEHTTSPVTKELRSDKCVSCPKQQDSNLVRTCKSCAKTVHMSLSCVDSRTQRKI